MCGIECQNMLVIKFQWSKGKSFLNISPVNVSIKFLCPMCSLEAFHILYECLCEAHSPQWFRSRACLTISGQSMLKTLYGLQITIVPPWGVHPGVRMCEQRYAYIKYIVCACIICMYVCIHVICIMQSKGANIRRYIVCACIICISMYTYEMYYAEQRCKHLDA